MSLLAQGAGVITHLDRKKEPVLVDNLLSTHLKHDVPANVQLVLMGCGIGRPLSWICPSRRETEGQNPEHRGQFSHRCIGQAEGHQHDQH